MPVMQPPTGPIQCPRDIRQWPLQYRERWRVGASYFHGCTAKPSDLFKGSNMPGFQATVTCRLLMPMETAEQLSRTLAEAFSKAAQPTDTRPQIIKLTDPPGKG